MRYTTQGEEASPLHRFGEKQRCGSSAGGWRRNDGGSFEHHGKEEERELDPSLASFFMRFSL
jgi:hypothetical protein